MEEEETTRRRKWRRTDSPNGQGAIFFWHDICPSGLLGGFFKDTFLPSPYQVHLDRWIIDAAPLEQKHRNKSFRRSLKMKPESMMQVNSPSFLCSEKKTIGQKRKENRGILLGLGWCGYPHRGRSKWWRWYGGVETLGSLSVDCFSIDRRPLVILLTLVLGRYSFVAEGVDTQNPPPPLCSCLWGRGLARQRKYQSSLIYQRTKLSGFKEC